MEIRQDFVDSIGNTPLIRLRKASELTGCTILGKAEFLNPGGSVKDRAARAIILDAEKKGLLRPGGLIVEGTAGNTGIGLALVGNARGYRTLIVIPETQSEEKKDMLRLCGAVVVEPAILLADEPTGNLDVETGEQIANLLFDLVRDTQMTLLMVTHNRDLAARCQRQVVLQQGQLAEL